MKKLIFVISATLFAINVYSAYLRNVPVDLKQPDGTIIHCFITGDEFHRLVHDKDNYTIIQNPQTKYFVYAKKEGEELVPSDLIVGLSDPSKRNLQPRLDISENKVKETRSVRLKSAKIENHEHYAIQGERDNIVIFIRFADENEFVDNISEFEDLFNGDGSSMKHYFEEVSKNQVKIQSHFYPLPTANNIVSYQDVHTRNYYEEYDSEANPDGYTTDGGERERTLLKNAIEEIKPQIENNSLILDANNDGWVDNVSFIIQGSPSAWSSVIWPHMGGLNTEKVSINGKRVDYYTLQVSTDINLQVICHEMFHSLGAPDLYHYNGGSEPEPVACWDLMSGTMTHMITWMKYKYGGWFNNIPIIKNSGIFKLPSVSDDPFACYKIPVAGTDNEFFMVEYRKKKGFDNNLPFPWNCDEGLLVYRVNIELTGNAFGPPDELYVLRPGITENLPSGNLRNATFSDVQGRTFINNISDPLPILSDGRISSLNISEVRVIGDSIEFKIGMPSNQCLPIVDQQQNQYNMAMMPDKKNKRWQEFTPTMNKLGFVEINVQKLGNPGNIIIEIQNSNQEILAKEIIPEANISTGWIKAVFLNKINLEINQKYKIVVYTDKESLDSNDRYFLQGFQPSNYNFGISDMSEEDPYYSDFDYQFRTGGCFFDDQWEITGPTTICPGVTQTYSVTDISEATSYSWSLPNGWTGSSATNSITAKVGEIGGTISVVGNYLNSQSTPVTLNVDVTEIYPEQPEAISGSPQVCQGQNAVSYLVEEIPNATNYEWSYSGTGAEITKSETNNITINFTFDATSGVLTVAGSNSCGIGPKSNLSVFINAIKNIQENISICEGETFKGWDAEGQYTETLTSASGCDSTVVTNLSFFPSYRPIIEVQGDTLMSSDNYQSYQWWNGNGEIPGASNKQYIISKSGIYYLVIKDNNGCTNTSNPFQVVYSTIQSTSIDNFKYSIIPNPNIGKFIFMIDSKPEGELTLKLINTIGQVFEIRELKSTEFNHIEQFDISHLSKGIYYLVISTNKYQKSEKIVLQ